MPSGESTNAPSGQPSCLINLVVRFLQCPVVSLPVLHLANHLVCLVLLLGWIPPVFLQVGCLVILHECPVANLPMRLLVNRLV